MKAFIQRRMSLVVVTATLVSLSVFLSSCSSGPSESESKMTSFASSESKADTAELFSVPKNQMEHIQVVPAVKGPLPRTLRLAGAVAYNAFETTPVFAAIGGPVHEILVAPGNLSMPASLSLQSPVPTTRPRDPPT